MNNKKAFQFSLISFLVAFFLFAAISWLIFLNIEKNEREELKEKIEILDYKITSALQKDIQIIDVLSGYITARPDISKTEFDYIANQVTKNHTNKFLSIQWVDGTNIKYVYPKNNSTKAIGLDLKEYPTTKKIISAFKNKNKAHHNGPVPLFQGGTGYIYRTPVYSSSNNLESFIGFTAIVIEIKTLEEQIEEISSDFNYAIRLSEGSPEYQYFNNGVFIGDEDFFKDADIIKKLEITNKKWEVGIKSKFKNKTFYYFIISITSSFILASIISYFIYKNRIKIMWIARQRKLLIEKNKEIEKQVSEKVILLNEIHHRVKNNFQLISSLARLQSYEIEDEKAIEALQEFSSRVTSLALTHEHLLSKDGSNKTAIKPYIEALYQGLEEQNSFKTNVHFDIDSIELEIKTVINLGIILNEMITNSIKYAFGNEPNSEIFITLKQNENQFILTYLDNGNQLPENVLEQDEESFGIVLIKTITEQLDGKVTYKRKGLNVGFQIIF